MTINWLGELLCVGDYLVGCDVWLLVYFAPLLSLKLLNLLQKLLLLEPPSDMPIEPSYLLDLLASPELTFYGLIRVVL
jgi:hypothetical protein